jgi:hypothetical protein
MHSETEGGRVHRRVSYFWKEPAAASGYNAAVSLHGHTSHSKEALYFISDYAKDIAPLRWALSREERRAKRKGGIRVDFQNSYWIPPVSPRSAYDSERNQITEHLHLAGMVSLTDHDSIDAPILLHTLTESCQIPISLEWSVPYGGTELHLGIHNLPAKSAAAIVKNLNDYTASPTRPGLHDLLSSLHKMREVLIVLNHPMWDLSRMGQEHHTQATTNFMALFGQFIHAFELGGLRGWDENQRTVDFAAGWNQPVISGGDRHGLEPNACVNLTNATSFSEFADEVRHGRSHVLFMPQYTEPLALRIIRVVNDVIRTYAGSPLGATWDDRVFHPNHDGVERPLSELWDEPPSYIRMIFSLFKAFESTTMRHAAQAFVRPEQQLRLTLSGELS